MKKIAVAVIAATLLMMNAGTGITATQVDYCFERAGQEYGVNPFYLWLLSQEEGRHNPKAIHYNKDGTYDYCHMQINSSWANDIGPERWAALADPCQCTRTGAWILSQCIAQYGDTWKAIGCYHSRTPSKNKKYAWQIYRAAVSAAAQNKYLAQKKNDDVSVTKGNSDLWSYVVNE